MWWSSMPCHPSKSLEKIAPLSAPFKQTLIISDSEFCLYTNKPNIEPLKSKWVPNSYDMITDVR